MTQAFPKGEPTTLDEVVEIMSVLGLNNVVADPRRETRLAHDMGLDDLDCLELQIAIEDKFDIEISDDDRDLVVTAGDLVDLVERKLAETSDLVRGAA